MHTSADLDLALRKFWEAETIAISNGNNEVYTPIEKGAICNLHHSVMWMKAMRQEYLGFQKKLALENNHVSAQKRLENLE